MAWRRTLKCLWPTYKMVLEISKPDIFQGLANIWENTELYFAKQHNQSERKTAMFTDGAFKFLEKKGIKISKSDMNLLREVVHKKMTTK